MEGSSKTTEERLFELVHHHRFLRLASHHGGEGCRWTIYHTNHKGDEGAMTSGSLPNLLTVWESNCEESREDGDVPNP